MESDFEHLSMLMQEVDREHIEYKLAITTDVSDVILRQESLVFLLESSPTAYWTIRGLLLFNVMQNLAGSYRHCRNYVTAD